MSLKQVVIHTDGACEGNPGPGGWAVVLRCGEVSKCLSGGAPATTNNRMEMKAAIEALIALKQPCEVQLFTDSEYLKNGITKWVFAWKARGWLTKEKKPVKNQDLWRELDVLTSRHRVKWQWVKGHAGNVDNEKCDLLAKEEIGKLHRQYTRSQLKELVVKFREGVETDENTLL